MSTISELKKLLKAADSNECFTSGRASNRIRALAGVIALALVESQKALKRCESVLSEEGWPDCSAATDAYDALRMDDLKKAMER